MPNSVTVAGDLIIVEGATRLSIHVPYLELAQARLKCDDTEMALLYLQRALGESFSKLENVRNVFIISDSNRSDGAKERNKVCCVSRDNVSPPAPGKGYE